MVYIYVCNAKARGIFIIRVLVIVGAVVFSLTPVANITSRTNNEKAAA